MGASNFRKKLQDPVNLFSFQDIIIGVTGILIMFTLILILSSQDSGKGSAGVASKEQLEKLEKMQKKTRRSPQGSGWGIQVHSQERRLK